MLSYDKVNCTLLTYYVCLTMLVVENLLIRPFELTQFV